MSEKRDHKMLNVIIADDHQLFVESLKLLLQSTDAYHFNVVGVAYTGSELLELLKVNRPDLLILDINIPSKNGLEVLQEVRKRKGLEAIHRGVQLSPAGRPRRRKNILPSWRPLSCSGQA